MTIDELITQIRGRVADLSDEAYGDALLITYINDGMKDFAQTGCFQYTETFNADGSSEYTPTLTYDWLVIYGVDYNGKPLDFAHVDDMRKWEPAAGTPLGWSIWADTIYLDAIAATLTNGVRVWYVYTPDNVTAVNNTLPLDEKWSPALVSYCAFRCLEGDRDGHGNGPRAEYDAFKLSAATIYQAQMSFGGYSK